jgi:Flp pilus assembly protein TadD
MDAGDAADVLRRLKQRMTNGETDAAIQELVRLAQLGEASADAHYELGFALAKAGRIAEATESWSSFLALVSPASEQGRIVRELVGAGDQITRAVREHYNDG